MMNLKELITSKGITQVELMGVLNCSASQVSLLINGKRRMSLEVANKLANRLDVTLNDIFLALNFTKRKAKQRCHRERRIKNVL